MRRWSRTKEGDDEEMEQNKGRKKKKKKKKKNQIRSVLSVRLLETVLLVAAKAVLD